MILEAQPVYPEPTFTISEHDIPEAGEKKIGQRVRTIINYEVIEKTKNYTILRISSIYLKPTARNY